MEYRKFESAYLLRLDRGEEITASLLRLAEEEGIRLAQVSGIGAIHDFTVGLFDPAVKQYFSNRFTGNFEIVSLTGNLTVMEGKPYLHLHLSAADAEGRVVGGHLNRAEVSATCEIFLSLLPGEVGRSFSPEIGLNLLRF